MRLVSLNVIPMVGCDNCNTFPTNTHSFIGTFPLFPTCKVQCFFIYLKNVSLYIENNKSLIGKYWQIDQIVPRWQLKKVPPEYFYLLKDGPLCRQKKIIRNNHPPLHNMWKKYTGGILLVICYLKLFTVARRCIRLYPGM